MILVSVVVALNTVIIGCAKRGMMAGTPVQPIVSMDGVTGATLSFQKLTDRISRMDVIFVGEIHTDSMTHVTERALLEAVHRNHPELAVALEMFERDVQGILNEYLAGRIDEETFLKTSRPWGNYPTDYRPLVEFAKEKGLPVLAMNVPRRYAAKVAMQGESAIAALPDSERVWVARELKVPDDEYKKRFRETMSGGMPGPMARMDPDALYAAQCLKDDTMAESIADFLKTHPASKMISYQGDFHSAGGLGMVGKLKLLAPGVKTVVISIRPVPNIDHPVFEEHKGNGDYLIFVPGKAVEGMKSDR